MADPAEWSKELWISVFSKAFSSILLPKKKRSHRVFGFCCRCYFDLGIEKGRQRSLMSRFVLFFFKCILQIINSLCFSLHASSSLFHSGVGAAETVIKLQILVGGGDGCLILLLLWSSKTIPLPWKPEWCVVVVLKASYGPRRGRGFWEFKCPKGASSLAELILLLWGGGRAISKKKISLSSRTFREASEPMHVAFFFVCLFERIVLVCKQLGREDNRLNLSRPVLHIPFLICQELTSFDFLK